MNETVQNAAVVNPWDRFSKQPQASADISQTSAGKFFVDAAIDRYEVVSTKYGFKFIGYNAKGQRFPIGLSAKLGATTKEAAEMIVLTTKGLVLFYGETSNGTWLTFGLTGHIESTGIKTLDLSKFAAGA